MCTPSNTEYLWQFDAIVMRIEVPGVCIKDRDNLSVNVSFFKSCCPVITGTDRVNVVYFCCGEPLCEFKSGSECLREALLCNGINFMVTYCGKKLGCGAMAINERLANKLCAMQGGEIIHTGDVELTCANRTTGIMTIRFRLRQLCQEESGDEEEFEFDPCGGTCCSDPCSPPSDCDPPASPCDPPSPCSPPPSPCSPPPPCPRSCGGNASPKPSKPACGNNDESPPANNFFDMIDAFCGAESSTAERSKSSQKCVTKSSDESSTSKDPNYNYEIQTPAHKIPRALGDEMVDKICPKISAPLLKQTHFKTPRKCPVCSEDVSWLPKFAACVYCNYRPVPVTQEKPYNEKATADDLLVQQLEFTNDDASSQISPLECSGPGKDDRVAAGNDEDFETLIRNYKYLKQKINRNKAGVVSCDKLSKAFEKPKNKLGNEEGSPNLANVFTELKTIFDRQKEKSKAATLAEVCQDATNFAKAFNKTKHRRAAIEKDMTRLCEPPGTQRKKNKRRSTQFKSKVYSKITLRGESHTRLGHKTCINGYAAGRKNVPGHMGWLWTSTEMASNPNWRPGSIRRSIRELMGYFLEDFPLDGLPVSKYMSYYKGKRPKAPPRTNAEKSEDLVQYPTLHVLKKNDEYILTLRPLKSPDDLAKCANPYLDMKPIKFRIVKNPFLKELRDMKRCLKRMGFSKCTCHRPVVECYCRSFVDKKQLIYEMNKECRRRNLENCQDSLVLSDTTESEDEFDFAVTPPAGVIKPERLHKFDIINAETQYDENDWSMPTLFPHPPNALVQYAGCSIGERKARFNYIFGKGPINVEEKPKKRKIKEVKKKKGKRLAGGGETSYMSHFSSDQSTDEERIIFENKKLGLMPNTLKKSRLTATRVPAKDPFSIQFKPLSNTRIRRLELASIPPARRGKDVNGQPFMQTPFKSDADNLHLKQATDQDNQKQLASPKPNVVQRTAQSNNRSGQSPIRRPPQFRQSQSPVKKAKTVAKVANATKLPIPQLPKKPLVSQNNKKTQIGSGSTKQSSSANKSSVIDRSRLQSVSARSVGSNKGTNKSSPVSQVRGRSATRTDLCKRVSFKSPDSASNKSSKTGPVKRSFR